jgi:hypothetical protein
MRTLPPFCSPGSKEEEEAAAQLLPFPPPALALLSALPLTPKLALHCDALRPRPRVMVPWQGLQYLHNLARGRKMERGGTGQGRKAGSRAGVDWVACPMCRRGSHWRKEGILNFGFNKHYSRYLASLLSSRRYEPLKILTGSQPGCERNKFYVTQRYN